MSAEAPAGDDATAATTKADGYGESGAPGGSSTNGSDATDGTSSSGSETGGGTGVDLGPCALDDGQCIFRHDTFGDEQLWTDVLRLHELVETLPPSTALAVGLKVDVDAVPPDVLATADLEDPATTVALLQLDAVVGVKASVKDGKIERIGVTCALCHSTVDDSALPGVGHRLDGWPNRDLDTGLIISLTPGLPALAASLGVDTQVAADRLQTWGPGRYDARFNQDGQSHPVLIPPAYGLEDVALATYTGEGTVSYWNAYVAVTQMGAHGNFSDEKLGLDIVQEPDLVTPKLPALRDYQFSLQPPAPPSDSFDADAAKRGAELFAGKAQCSTCHTGASFTDAPTLHAPEETAMDPTEAMRGTTGKYRTTPLRGAWEHPPYFHDGSAATFADVVDHYDVALSLGLYDGEKDDLVHYLRSL